MRLTTRLALLACVGSLCLAVTQGGGSHHISDLDERLDYIERNTITSLGALCTAGGGCGSDDLSDIYVREQLLLRRHSSPTAATAGNCLRVRTNDAADNSCVGAVTEFYVSRDFTLTALDLAVVGDAFTTTEGCKLAMLVNDVSQGVVFEMGDSTSVAASGDTDTAQLGIAVSAGDKLQYQISDPDADGCPDGAACDCDAAAFDIDLALYAREVR